MNQLLLLLATLGAGPSSALLSRLNLRTCAEAFSPARRDRVHAWFRAEVGRERPTPHVVVHGFENLGARFAGQRAFLIDETLERLGEQATGTVGRGRIDFERWQLEVSAAGPNVRLPRGFTPVLLGDRIEFDLGEHRVLAGEFVIGIHWEPPADPRLSVRLERIVKAAHAASAFASIPLRALHSGDVSRGELYVLLDGAGDAETRFERTLNFLREITRELELGAAQRLPGDP